MKKIVLSIMIIAMLTFAIPAVSAAGIRIDPHGSYYGLDVMQTSPATFNVYLKNGAGIEPHIFLAMPASTYLGLTDSVTVSWPSAVTPVTITTWHKETDNSAKVPPGCAGGSDYTVAAIKDHLQTTEDIYWAFVPFLDAPLSKTPTEFTVAMTSSASNPRMMVYVLAKEAAGANELFTNSIPATQPGFVVPELATILLATASLSALGIYALKRKRNSISTVQI
jgi:hypothetical protein